MKTRKNIIWASLAILGLLTLSCTRESLPGDTGNQAPSKQENPSKPSPLPDVVPDGYVRITLTSGIESGAPQAAAVEGTRLHITEGSGTERIVNWDKDDEIKIFYDGGTTTALAEESGAVTHFTFDVPQETQRVYMVYPADGDFSLDDDKVILSLSDTQNGDFGGYLAATSDLDSDDITFRHFASYFKIVLTDGTLTKAVIEGNGGEALTGTLSATLDESSITPGTPSETASSLTLNFNGAGTYYAALLPGRSFPQGVTLSFFRGTAPAGAYKYGSDLSVARADISFWGEMDRVACNRYVVENGAGSKNGRSWANAWGADELRAFLTHADGTSAEDLALMNGITVRIAAGTFVMPSGGNVNFALSSALGEGKVMSLNFVGGYPADGGDLSNPASNVSVLSGGNQYNVLRLTQAANLSFQGLTFTGGKMSSGGTGVLTLNGTGNISLSNCIFTGNTNSATTGALNIAGGSHTTVSHCSFTGNTAGNAGAVNIDNAATVAVFSDCTFSGNSLAAVASGNGGAMKVSNGTVTLENCTFSNNTTIHSAETGSHGGALWLDGGTVTASGCTFTGNVSRWGGAVYTKNSVTGTFDACTFGGSASGAGNKTELASGGVFACDGGTITLSDCTMQGNSANDRGGCIFVSSANTSLTIDGGTFSSNSAPNGGVVYVQGSAVANISNATFSANTATSGGGALTMASNATVNLSGNTFSNNSCTNAGGAVAIYGTGGTASSTNAPTLNINGGNLFSGNHSVTGGGAIRIRQEPAAVTSGDTAGNETKANLNISGSGNVFSGNYSDGYGGCLDLRTSGTVSIDGATFSGNYTKKDAGTGKGGALNLSDASFGTGDFTLTNCTFTGNHTFGGTSTANTGGAINVGGNNSNWALKVKVNKCRFSNNYGKQGGAIAFYDASATTYLNDCLFTGNYISSRYGTTLLISTGTVCLNNCSFADDTYSTENLTNINEQCTWINVKATKLMMSNCTLIGQTRRQGVSVAPSGNACLLRFDGIANTHYLINNIIASNATSCYSIWADNAPVINAVSNKLSAKLWKSGSTVTFNTSGEHSEDYQGTSAYLSGLGWTSGTSWNDGGWFWSGTLSGGSNTNKALLKDVAAAIQTADNGFYTWLSGLGALSQDGRGVSRGDVSSATDTTWPGAYQN